MGLICNDLNFIFDALGVPLLMKARDNNQVQDKGWLLCSMEVKDCHIFVAVNQQKDSGISNPEKTQESEIKEHPKE